MANIQLQYSVNYILLSDRREFLEELLGLSIDSQAERVEDIRKLHSKLSDMDVLKLLNSQGQKIYEGLQWLVDMFDRYKM